MRRSATIIMALFPSLVATLGAEMPYLEIQPDTARVGDPVQVRIVIPGRTNPDSITWPDVHDKLGDLSLLRIDTLSGKQAKNLPGIALQYTVAAYDTGAHSTGPLEFTVGESPWTLPGEKIHIASILADTTVNLRPLKSQAELPFTFLDFLHYYGPWIGGALLAMLLVWVGRRWWKHRGSKKSPEVPVIPEMPPYEQAVAALQDLKANNPLVRGDIRSYVSKLVFITKRLMERSSGDPVLEMTSFEVRRWLKLVSIPFDSRKLQELLSASDFVKFARGTLDAKAATGVLSVVEEIVESYRPIPEKYDFDENSHSQDGSSSHPDTASETVQNPRGGSAGMNSQSSAEPAEPSSWSIPATADKPPSHDSDPRLRYAPEPGPEPASREERS